MTSWSSHFAQSTSPRSLEENADLREKIRHFLKSGQISQEVHTNIKAFIPINGCQSSPNAEHYHACCAVEPNLRLGLSVEKPGTYEHDLSGLLHLLEKLPPSALTADDAPLLVQLDGGWKSRNFLLTLSFVHQGLFPLLRMAGSGSEQFLSNAWSEGCLSLMSVASQLPGAGRHWLVVGASDYDLIPERLTVGRQPLGKLPGQAARLRDSGTTSIGDDLRIKANNVVGLVTETNGHAHKVRGVWYHQDDVEAVSGQIVVFGVPVSLDLHLLQKHQELLAAKLDSVPSEELVSTLQHLLAQPAKDAGALSWADTGRALLDQLLRLCTKGILVCDSDGLVSFYVEKPPLAQLLRLLQLEGMSLMEDLMYISMSKALLPRLLHEFGREQSQCFPGFSLRSSLPIGFCSSLLSAPHLELQEWFCSQWSKLCPASTVRAQHPRISDEQVQALWHCDGKAVWQCARRVMEGVQVFVARLGENAHIGELGTPAEYMEAQRWRVSRLLRQLPPPLNGMSGAFRCEEHCGVRVLLCPQSSLQDVRVDRVPVTDKAGEGATLILINSCVQGNGTLRLAVAGQNHTRGSVALLCDSLLRVAADETLQIGEEASTSNFVFMTSCHCSNISGEISNSILATYDSRCSGADSVDQQTALMRSARSHIDDVHSVLQLKESALATIALAPAAARMPQASCGVASYSAALQLKVGQAEADGQLAPLEQPRFMGNNFKQAACCLDLRWKRRQTRQLLWRLQMLKLEPPQEPDLGRGGCAFAHEFFQNIYGSGPQHVASAPGRLNIGAAHTDWAYMRAAGFALKQHVWVAVSKNPDHWANAPGTASSGHTTGGVVTLFSLTKPNMVPRALLLPPLAQPLPKAYEDKHSWTDYVIGMLSLLRTHEANEVLMDTGTVDSVLDSGMDVLVGGDLPIGAGLSSSAALQLAAAAAFLSLAERPVRPAALARLANFVEQHYIGLAGDGIMDMLVSACAQAGKYVVVDCRRDTPSVEQCVRSAMPGLGYSIAVLDTATQHHNAPGTCSKMRHVLPAEMEESDFTARVLRYWCAVALLTSPRLFELLPNATQHALSLESAANPRLQTDEVQLERRCLELPEKLALMHCTPEQLKLQQPENGHEHASVLASAVEAFRKTLVLPAGVCWLQDRARSEQSVLPVLVRMQPTQELQADWEPCRQFMFMGALSGVNVDTELIEGAELVNTAPLLRVVRFMVREDWRIKALAALMQTAPACPEQHSELLAATLRLHAERFQRRGMLMRAQAEIEAASTLASRGNLSAWHLALVEGALGDVSWEDKRDLFEGDTVLSDGSSILQSAYDIADSVCNESDQFRVLGKLAPGAGWAGVAAVYMNTQGDEGTAALRKLECMMTGAPVVTGMPDNFVPYSQRRLTTREGLDVQIGHSGVWIAQLSHGL